MDECPRCGATRVADLWWCGQCHLRFDLPGPADPPNTVVMSGAGAGDDGLHLPLWARAVISLTVIAGGGVLIVGFGPWWDLGRPAWALGTIILVVYATFGGVLVARLWAPGSFTGRTEHIVVLDEHAMAEVEARHQSLAVGNETDAGPS